jgi:hypothetical protein
MVNINKCQILFNLLFVSILHYRYSIRKRLIFLSIWVKNDIIVEILAREAMFVFDSDDNLIDDNNVYCCLFPMTMWLQIASQTM